MAVEKIEDILLQYCDKEVSTFNRTRFFLYRKSIRLALTRILESWEKDANLSLPDYMCFPKNSCHFRIDRKGIYINRKLTHWSKIEMTAIAVHYIDGGRREHHIQNYFMAYTKNGEVINQQVGDLKDYSNLFGHFIELYKIDAQM